jgi:hypothetical protein
MNFFTFTHFFILNVMKTPTCFESRGVSMRSTHSLMKTPQGSKHVGDLVVLNVTQLCKNKELCTWWQFIIN